MSNNTEEDEQVKEDVKKKKAPYFRPLPKKKSWPVTPKMLIKTLERLRETKVFGVYFTPSQIMHALARKYPWVEQDLSKLFEEIKDKLLCAAAADLIGYKVDSGYYALTSRTRCVRIDTRSELMFWFLYKKIVEDRKMMRRGVQTGSDTRQRQRQECPRFNSSRGIKGSCKKKRKRVSMCTCLRRKR